MYDYLRSSGSSPKCYGDGSISEAWRDLSHFVTNSRSIEHADAGDSSGGHADHGQGQPHRSG